jgi:manganese transport protein
MHHLFTFLRSIGPAIVVAAVVCGPGSMLMSSKTGAIYGYQMIWLVAAAAGLMWSMVALSARLGVLLEETPLGELAQRLGRPVAAVVGTTLFLVVLGFQVSNNIAIIAAIEPFLPRSLVAGSVASAATPLAILTGLNFFVLAAVYRFRNLYRLIERLLKGVVFVVILCFVINLLLVRPDPIAMLGGLIPSAPARGFAAMLAPRADPDVTVLQALVATTFSVAGAFYQAYSVRARGWTVADARQGLTDSLVGISVLAGVSIVLMSTAAAALHGGNMLADGFGCGATMNDTGTRHATAAALLIAMAIACGCILAEVKPVAAITLAQASTVVGLPALSLSLLFLAISRNREVPGQIPRWMLVAAAAGLIVTLFLTVRTLMQLITVLG